MSDFEAQRAAALETVENLRSVAMELGDGPLASACIRSRESVESTTFSVAVVGEFKAGKSTLINAMIGQDILPSATCECSAVVTRLRATEDGESLGVVVTFEDGGREHVEHADLKSLVTVKGVEASARKAVDAEVLIDADRWFADSVELVDTPGLGAAGRAREVVTLNYLPNADAVVFITRADQAMNESELRFLKERIIDDVRAGIFLVVNYADALTSDKARAEVRQRVAERTDGLVPSNHVYLLSASDAMDAIEFEDPEGLDASGFLPFKAALTVFLQQNRQSAMANAWRQEAETLRLELLRGIDRQLEDAELDHEERQLKIPRIKQLISMARTDVERISQDFSSAFDQTCRRPIHNDIARISAGVQELLEDVKPDAEHLKSRARRILDESGGAAVTAIQQKMINELRALHSNCARDLDRILRRTALKSGEEDDHVNFQRAAPSFSELVIVSSYQEEVKEYIPGSGSNGYSESGMAGAIAGAVFGAAIGGPLGAIIGGIGGAFFGENFGGGGGRFRTRNENRTGIDIQNSVELFQTSLQQFADELHADALAQTTSMINGVIFRYVRVQEDRLADLDRPVVSMQAIEKLHRMRARLIHQPRALSAPSL